MLVRLLQSNSSTFFNRLSDSGLSVLHKALAQQDKNSSSYSHTLQKPVLNHQLAQAARV